jgi:hypothetical protein
VPGRALTSMNAKRPFRFGYFARSVITWPMYLMVESTLTSREYALGLFALDIRHLLHLQLGINVSDSRSHQGTPWVHLF